MKVTCPKCEAPIAPNDVNIAQALLFCRHCNEMFPLMASEELEEPIPEDFNIDMPPSGAWCEPTFEGEAIGGNCRSIGGALFTFVFAAMFGGMPLAIAFSDDFGKEGIAQYLFLLPFLAVGASAACVFLTMLFGKSEVTLSRGSCRAFTGVGNLGFKTDFFAADVTGIYRRECGKKNGQPMYNITLERENAKPVKFGMFLSDEKQLYVFNALKVRLREYQD